MNVEIRRFTAADIPFKVKWINDERNNQFLHYDLPLEEGKTLEWFRKVKDRTDRADYTITCDGEPAGLIGLINIDQRNRKAEYYITLGEERFKGQGAASRASRLLLEQAFSTFGLNKVYLYTEVENFPAQKLFEGLGFRKEGHLKEDLIHAGTKADRFYYGMLADEFKAGDR